MEIYLYFILHSVIRRNIESCILFLPLGFCNGFCLTTVQSRRAGEAYLLPEGERNVFPYCTLRLAMQHQEWMCQRIAAEGITNSLVSQNHNISSSFLRRHTFSRGNQSPQGVTSNRVLLESPYKTEDFDKSSYIKLYPQASFRNFLSKQLYECFFPTDKEFRRLEECEIQIPNMMNSCLQIK